jgi:DNA-binding MarR family transcriptional regulator
MLRKDFNRPDKSFTEVLERYLGATLHARIDVTCHDHTGHLPSFLVQRYKICQSRIGGRHCVFLIAEQDMATPSEIAKHVNLVRKEEDAIVIFVIPAMSVHNRNRLIKHGIPFIVPGNQLYIPELAMDLREHFRANRIRRTEGLSPVAQAVLFHSILKSHQHATTPTQLSEHLHYSPMSIGRAFDDLTAAGFAKSTKLGKERHIEFKEERRDLFDKALPHLRSPVQARKFVRDGHMAFPLKKAGESALAVLTELSWPLTPIYAVASRDWKIVSERCGFIETVRNEAELIIETWTYDPRIFAHEETVDPLSLHVQFHKHEDPRIQIAADELLGIIKW